MNKTTLFSMAVTAAVAGTAAAQTPGVTYHFDANGDPLTADTITVNVGDTVSWTVWASFEGYSDASAYFGGFVGDFDASDPLAGQASNITTLMAGEAVVPTADGASIQGINIFNSALLGTNDPANPIAIMTFDTEVTTANGWNYQAEGVSSVFPDDGIFTLPDEYTGAAIISDTVVIPAPGALALVGMGGLAVARRRR